MAKWWCVKVIINHEKGSGFVVKGETLMCVFSVTIIEEMQFTSSAVTLLTKGGGNHFLIEIFRKKDPLEKKKAASYINQHAFL
jgi:hypothetical protein